LKKDPEELPTMAGKVVGFFEILDVDIEVNGLEIMQCSSLQETVDRAIQLR
jgi:hypothetical protein